VNDIPYSEIKECEDFAEVRLHVQNGWICLNIYKKKVQVFGTSSDFEEKPVYIMGNPQGG
jgi:hypothetical protein